MSTAAISVADCFEWLLPGKTEREKHRIRASNVRWLCIFPPLSPVNIACFPKLLLRTTVHPWFLLHFTFIIDLILRSDSFTLSIASSSTDTYSTCHYSRLKLLNIEDPSMHSSSSSFNLLWEKYKRQYFWQTVEWTYVLVKNIDDIFPRWMDRAHIF